MKEEKKPFGKWPTGGLPQYSPPDALWERIIGELELQEALTKLPLHEPPTGAWGAVEAALDGKSGGARTFMLSTTLRWAAGLALLIGSALIYQIMSSNEGQSLEYRVEWSMPGGGTFEGGEPGSARSIIDQLCARAIPICESTDFKAMEDELYKLEQAREEIEARMSPYTDNDPLERMLMQIELQHAEIVKQMTNSLL